MNTKYPERFEIKLNRDELEKSFIEAEQVVIMTTLFAPLLALWAWLFMKGLDWLLYTEIPKNLGLFLAFIISSISAVLAFLLLSSIYRYIWGKKKTAKRAKNFLAEVDGAFLRIVDGKSDRKIHFRQIGDYEAIRSKKEDSLVGAIRMRTIGLNTQFLILNGVEDLIPTRDLLAEVDAERE